MVRKLTDPIALGLLLTIGFVGAVGYLIYPKLDQIGGLKLNELGDFLAGISSTLAFIWIIIAVLLQRDELQAQRDELRQSREVYTLQAAELKRTADQQKIQVEIMQEQLKAAMSERKVRESLETANRRQQLQFRIQNLFGQLTALAVYRGRFERVAEELSVVPSGNWPKVQTLRRLGDLGLLHALLGPNPEAPVGPTAQNILQKLQSIANAARNHLNTVDNSQFRNAAVTAATKELDQLEQEIPALVSDISELLEEIREAEVVQRNLLNEAQAHLEAIKELQPLNVV